jgi:imidazolonepropionase-like amidohydrolase
MAGDRIAAVSRTPIDAARARNVIDATGLVVAPGFIDAHAHVENLAMQPARENFLRQGVTTVWYAADGGQPWPLRARSTRCSGAARAEHRVLRGPQHHPPRRSWARPTARRPPASWSR